MRNVAQINNLCHGEFDLFNDDVRRDRERVREKFPPELHLSHQEGEHQTQDFFLLTDD